MPIKEINNYSKSILSSLFFSFELPLLRLMMGIETLLQQRSVTTITLAIFFLRSCFHSKFTKFLNKDLIFLISLINTV